MQIRSGIHKGLLAVLCILMGCAYSVAYADPMTPRFGSPIYSTAERAVPRYAGSASLTSVPFSSSASVSPYGSISSKGMPTYQFRSTSPYSAIVGKATTFTPLADAPSCGCAPKRARRGFWDDEPEDDPIGVVPDPVPLGDIPLPLMVLFACLFLFYKRRYKQYKICGF